MNENLRSLLSIFTLHRLPLLLLGCAFQLVIIINCDAQDLQLNFKHLTSASGLSQCVVNSIFRDSRGYMWFATWDGINRFDGISIKSNDEIADGLSLSSFMAGTFEDADGNIWIGSKDALIQYSYRDDHFYSYNILNNSSDTHEGLEYYFPIAVNDTFVLLHPYAVQRKMIFNKKKKTFRELKFVYNETEDSIVSPVVPEFVGFRNNLIMYSKPHGKLIFHVIEQNKYGKYYWKPIITNIKSLHETYIVYDSGTIKLISSGSFLEKHSFTYYEFDPLTHSEKHIKFDDRINSFTHDDKFIYLSTDRNGIVLIDKDNFSIKGKIFKYNNSPSSLLTSNVTAMCISDGFIWVGCWGMGISYASLKPPIFTHHFGKKEAADSGTSSFIRGIVEDKKGHIWCNTLVDGVIEMDANLQYLKTLPNTKGHTISTIYLDEEDNLYFGDKGLQVYNISSKKMTFVGHRLAKYVDLPLASDYEYFSKANDGNIFTATLSGAYKFNRASRQLDTLHTTPGLWATFMEFIDTDRHGQIYSFNIYDGFCVLKPNLSRYDLVFNSHLPPIPRHFYDQNDSIVWIGTTNGLIKFNSKKMSIVQQFYKKDGLPNNVVYAIAPDTFGYLWLSTNKGISRFNSQTQEFINFQSSDYQFENEYNRHALCVTHDGRILFGSIDGITAVHPWNVDNKKAILTLQFTAVKSDKPYSPYKHQEENDPLLMKRGTTYIEFDFIGIDYESPKSHKLFYKLEGVNETWVKTGNPGNARFVNLSPGKYKFLIKSNADFQGKHAAIKTYYFEIQPFWWQTTWAKYVGAFVLVLSLILVIRNYIQSRLGKEKAALEEQMAIINERERIIADLHDDVGTTLSSMNIYSELAQKSASVNKEKMMEFVDKIAQHSNTLMHLMSDIIWSLKTNTDGIASIKSNVLDHFADVLETKEINLHTHFEDDLTFKDPHMRKNIVLIIKEAINNIIKYSSAKNAYISMKREGKSIHLEIRDDGVGLELNSAKRGNGLNNIYKRSESIGASCTMSSSSGNGLTISIAIPMPL